MSRNDIAAMGHPSPSLMAGRDDPSPAYELKFLLPAEQAREIERWAREHLTADPHADPDLNGAYHTTTLYLDTPQRDVYLRSPSYSRRKYRVRRYGSAVRVFLERKTKSADRVSKRRTMVDDGDLAMFGRDRSIEAWAGEWFSERIAMKNLGPAALVWYTRSAWVGRCDEGPLRLTIDRDIRGALAGDWLLPANAPSNAATLTNLVIVELKFVRALPQPFKQVVHDFRLSPAIVSKYRLCRDACPAAPAAAAQPTEIARA